MKLGIISDVHNNIKALNVVLNEFKKLQVEHIICAGDIIGIGPNPEEVVSRLREMKHFTCVKGNHESYFVDGMDRVDMDEHERQYHLWEHALLSEKSTSFLSSLSSKQVLSINDKTICVTHYASKNNHFVRIIKNPTVEELNQVFIDVDADIIIYGHNHKESYLIGDKIYINPGSLGCPGRDQNIARAGILSIEKDIIYTQLNIEYNVKTVLNQIDASDYPAKDIIKEIFYGTKKGNYKL